MEIPRRSKFKNFKKSERGRKRIILVKNWGEAKKELKEVLLGNKRGIEKYRMVEKAIVEITEKFGVTREKELKGDKLVKETLNLIARKNQLRKEKRGRKNHRIEINEMRKLIRKKVRKDIK